MVHADALLGLAVMQAVPLTLHAVQATSLDVSSTVLQLQPAKQPVWHIMCIGNDAAAAAAAPGRWAAVLGCFHSASLARKSHNQGHTLQIHYRSTQK
jgi:hypothetical protein